MALFDFKNIIISNFLMFLIPSWPSSITSLARANGNLVIAILPHAEKGEDLFELIFHDPAPQPLDLT